MAASRIRSRMPRLRATTRSSLPAIRSQLLSALAELATHRSPVGESLSLHDGLIRRVHLDLARRSLVLAMRVGDNGVGYADLELRYRGVDVSTLDLPMIEAWASQAHAEVLYHEIDVAPSGAFVHRLLLGPLGTGELAITFTDFSYRTIPQPNRSFPRAEPVFSIAK